MAPSLAIGWVMGLAMGPVDRAMAGDFFIAENPHIGYYFVTGEPSTLLRERPQASNASTDSFASPNGQVSLKVWKLEGEFSYEACAAETYIDRKVTPQTLRAGADTEGHWVQAQGRERMRLTKAMRSPGHCLLLQVDYPLSLSGRWNDVAWTIAASMERVRVPD